MSKILSICFAFIVLSCFGLSAQGHDKGNDVIVFHGSSTVYNFVFNGNKEEIERGLGQEINVLMNSSGRGVLALNKGGNDIAMISSDFATIVEKLNSQGDVTINSDEYNVHKIDETKIFLVVNKSNPLESITKQQAVDLFTGKISSWDQLDVPNLSSVRVVTEHPTGGVYNTISKTLLDGVPFKEKKIIMQNGPQTAIVVSQLDGAFGMLSDATPAEQKAKVKILKNDDFEIVQKMYFVTRKDTSHDNLDKVIKYIQNRFSH